ncbi:MAG: cell division protein FtsX [Rhodobacteraceae bacterium]|nr:cell division protein FtsX [Paracoccaceae bacterium]MCP5342653.1 cell division protein FtsX [Paracoccaceae bacterium]
MSRLSTVLARLLGDTEADKVVPRSGLALWLTVFTAAAMAFLSVLALAMSLATARLADRWSGAFEGRATILISAAPEAMGVQAQRVLDILAVTPGVASAHVVDQGEMRRLLAPWFGARTPIESLPVPQLIDVEETPAGFDAAGLALRLAAEVPDAHLDDHQRWRKPLVQAAARIRLVSVLSLILIGGATAAMLTLAALASLASHARVIAVLKLIGARDAYIARAFVRRFTLRSLIGAGLGTSAGMIALATLPGASAPGGLLTGLGFSGLQWLWPLAIPPLAAIIGFWVTRTAALHRLRRGE